MATGRLIIDSIPQGGSRSGPAFDQPTTVTSASLPSSVLVSDEADFRAARALIQTLIRTGAAFVAYIRAIVMTFTGIRAFAQLHAGSSHEHPSRALAFFHTTPIGRLLSRFSKDLDTLDTGLVTNVGFLHVSALRSLRAGCYTLQRRPPTTSRMLLLPQVHLPTLRLAHRHRVATPYFIVAIPRDLRLHQGEPAACARAPHCTQQHTTPRARALRGRS